MGKEIHFTSETTPLQRLMIERAAHSIIGISIEHMDGQTNYFQLSVTDAKDFVKEIQLIIDLAEKKQ